MPRERPSIGETILFYNWYKSRGRRVFRGRCSLGKIIDNTSVNMKVQMYTGDYSKSYSTDPTHHVNILSGLGNPTSHIVEVTPRMRVIDGNDNSHGMSYAGIYDGKEITHSYYCD